MKALVLTSALFASAALAGERISLAIKSGYERDARIIGELTMPDSSRERLPAVLILTSSPGFDGRSAFYAEALVRAGFATLEIDMFQGRGLPASPRHNLPHVYQALDLLSRQPRIDASRIGIMGVSWGGNVSVLASFEELAKPYANGKQRFAAHLALYPGCWVHHAVVAGRPGNWKHLRATDYRRPTGSPVHILAAGKNDYDSGRDLCAQFVSALPAEARRHYAVTTYAGATFGWDSRFSQATYDATAWEGKGGIVNVIADPAMAKQSQEFAVAYFRRNLKNE